MSLVDNIVGKPSVIGFVGDVNTGKSNTLYYILEELAKNYKYSLYYYGLSLNFNKVHSQRIYSIRELEEIKNSVIVVDELASLFDLDNRKNRKIIEQTFRLINHNNNIIILCGTPENFKKFISGKLDKVIYKKVTIEDFINNSEIKNYLTNYKGVELGSAILNLEKSEALFFNGQHYEKLHIPYLKEYDVKANKEDIFVARESNITRKKKSSTAKCERGRNT